MNRKTKDFQSQVKKKKKSANYHNLEARTGEVWKNCSRLKEKIIEMFISIISVNKSTQINCFISENRGTCNDQVGLKAS